MRKIIEWFTSFFELIRNGFRFMGGGVSALIGFILAVVGILTALFNFIIEKVGEIHTGVGGLISSAQDSSWFQRGSVSGDILNFTNTFFPLAEAVAATSFLMATWIVCITVRTVKAWIPTLG